MAQHYSFCNAADNAAVMLSHRRRRWPNITAALCECLVFSWIVELRQWHCRRKRRKGGQGEWEEKPLQVIQDKCSLTPSPSQASEAPGEKSEQTTGKWNSPNNLFQKSDCVEVVWPCMSRGIRVFGYYNTRERSHQHNVVAASTLFGCSKSADTP